MRIDRLDLIAFGCFAGEGLDLSAGAPGLHVIHGENEAGKSTSLRALIAWLFGIEARTTDAFRHDMPKLRIGGRLRSAEGRELAFVRRKGNKGTLLDPETEEVLPDEVLAPFLPGLDRELFCRLHGIDHGRLVQGGREILEQTGDLGQALFSAATGVAGLSALCKDLQERSGSLFASRASRRPVNQAIQQFKDAKRRRSAASLQVPEWKRLHSELMATERQIAELEDGLKALGSRLHGARRGKRLQGPLAERRQVLSQLEAYRGVPRLDPGFAELCRRTLEELQNTRDHLDKMAAKLARKLEEATATETTGRLLESEEAIEALYRQLGAEEKARQDLPGQDAKHRQLKNRARTLLKGLRPDLDLAGCLELRPALLQRKLVGGLAKARGLLEQRSVTLDGSRREVEERLAARRERVATLGVEDQDLTYLRTAVEAAGQAGDLQERLADLEKRRDRENKALLQSVKRLGRLRGDPRDLASRPLPAMARLDEFVERRDELDQRARDAERRRRELEDERVQIAGLLGELLATGEILSLEDLQTARACRDEGWRLIRRRLLDGEEIPDLVRVYAGDEGLPEVYERRVEDADRVADRMRETADRVQQRARSEARTQAIQSNLERLSAEDAARKAELDEASREWEDLWTPLDVEPGSPREMKEWLGGVEGVRASHERLGEAEAELARVQEQERGHGEALAGALRALGKEVPEGQASAPLLQLARARLEEHERAAEQRRQLEGQLAEDRATLDRLRQERMRLEEERQRWSEEWDQGIAGLGMDPPPHPDNAAEIYEQFQELFGVLDDADAAAQRKWGIEQVSKRFDAEVMEFATTIGFDPAGRPAIEVARALHQALKQERTAWARREKLLAEIQELEGEVGDARLALESQEERLARLCKQAGVEGSDELVEVAARSADRQRLQGRLEALDQEIARGGDGLPIDQLEREVEALVAEEVDSMIEALEGQVATQQERRDEQRDRRSSLETEIAQKEAASGAAEAAEEMEQHLSAMVGGAREYLRLEMATGILQQLIEDYRQTNQAPVLRRAAELFSALTLGSFAGLRAEHDDTMRPVLLGVRPDRGEVHVEGMSEGTRDQLYLALRLATLEQSLGHGEPMPFVVDDILVSFDDRRTRAGLEVLAELGQRTQVLLFTHHARVVELASGVESPAGVILHELGRGGRGSTREAQA